MNTNLIMNMCVCVYCAIMCKCQSIAKKAHFVHVNFFQFKWVFPLFYTTFYTEWFHFFVSFNSIQLNSTEIRIHWSKLLFNWSLIEANFSFNSFWNKVFKWCVCMTCIKREKGKKVGMSFIHLFHYLLIYGLSSFSNKVNSVNLFSIFLSMEYTQYTHRNTQANNQTGRHARTQHDGQRTMKIAYIYIYK